MWEYGHKLRKKEKNNAYFGSGTLGGLSALFLLVLNLFREVFIMTEHWAGVSHEGIDGFNYTAGFCKSSLERVPTKVNRSC